MNSKGLEQRHPPDTGKPDELTWTDKAGRDFYKAAEHWPATVWEAPDAPAWVSNLYDRMSVGFYPRLRQVEDRPISAAKLGYFVGRHVAMFQWMTEVWDATKIPAEVLAKLSEEQLKKGEEWTRRLFEEFVPVWYRAVRRTLLRALAEEYSEARSFFAHFSQGLMSKPKTPASSAVGNSATEVEFAMLYCWRLIETFPSVRVLHQFLVRLFDTNRVGDQKRVEKICQRIGLSFRKPGRPPNVGNSDTSHS